MGMRGGAGSFTQRQGGEPGSSFGGRGGRPFGGTQPGFRRGEFVDRESFNRRPSPILQQAPAPYSRQFEGEPRNRPGEFSSGGFRGRSRDFSRGRESSRPQERSFQKREEQKVPAGTLRPKSSASQEKRTPRLIPKRQQRDTSRRRLNQSQRSDRVFTKSLDSIWVRADDSAFLYVKLAKGRLYHEKFEEIKFHGAGKDSIYTVFKAVEILTRYGYATIGSIKTSKLTKGEDEDTRSISKVEVTLKRSQDFEKIYEDFEKVVAAKREEYNKKKASG